MNAKIKVWKYETFHLMEVYLPYTWVREFQDSWQIFVAGEVLSDNWGVIFSKNSDDVGSVNLVKDVMIAKDTNMTVEGEILRVQRELQTAKKFLNRKKYDNLNVDGKKSHDPIVDLTIDLED